MIKQIYDVLQVAYTADDGTVYAILGPYENMQAGSAQLAIISPNDEVQFCPADIVARGDREIDTVIDTPLGTITGRVLLNRRFSFETAESNLSLQLAYPQKMQGLLRESKSPERSIGCEANSLMWDIFQLGFAAEDGTRYVILGSYPYMRAGPGQLALISPENEIRFYPADIIARGDRSADTIVHSPVGSITGRVKGQQPVFTANDGSTIPLKWQCDQAKYGSLLRLRNLFEPMSNINRPSATPNPKPPRTGYST